MEEKFSLNTKYISINPQKCRGCFGCWGQKACPKNAIGRVGTFWHKHSAFIKPENCNGCQKCVKACKRNVFTKQTKREHQKTEESTDHEIYYRNE